MVADQSRQIFVNFLPNFDLNFCYFKVIVFFTQNLLFQPFHGILSSIIILYGQNQIAIVVPTQL